ncbi:TIGR03545 family protein [Bowmanella sp. JS7-9]|uniref:TIGR03545 family protein n=1 Tax=Pseudobowmanella zhangzhouensis TaxID=1537679 RepID=A0ABW1XGB1_9ALTE|nr:TIGR03545 family protein [Bowmanella sp. JS7-9]TBX24566.1 hypothetical protein TK45_04670 [Bowmanella sp. JS7-9]
MRNVIRWPGLLAFVLVIGLIALISMLFIDKAVKYAIESLGADATGAEVNVGSVSHRYSPFGFTVEDIQVTNHSAPENNQVQIARASADVDLLALLMNKVIIDELTVDGVQFDQPRKSPGAVYRQPAADGSNSPFNLPDNIEMPSVDEIMANSPLKTTAAANEAETAYQQHKAAVEQAYQALPDKKKIEAYKTQLKALQDVKLSKPEDVIAAEKEFKQLKEALKQDKQKFAQFQQTLETAKQDLGPKLAALKAAPGQDFDLLKGLVAGDAAAFGELTESVFGPQARKWSDSLFAALDIVGPMLQQQAEQEAEQSRAAGTWYSFDDTTALPGFLIRKANVSIVVKGQSIASNWQDITTEHEVLGRPTLFSVDSKNSPLWDLLNIQGQLSLDSLGLNANQHWKLAGVKLQQLALANADKLSAVLNSALLASEGSLTLNHGALTGSGDIALRDVSIAAEGQNKLTNILAGALNGISSLNINSDISGTLAQPAFGLKSDLDNQLADAVKASLGGEAQQKLNSLQARLNAKADPALGTTGDGMQQWLKWEELADGNLGSVEDMLKAKFDNKLEQEKDKVLDKLKGKIFG